MTLFLLMLSQPNFGVALSVELPPLTATTTDGESYQHYAHPQNQLICQEVKVNVVDIVDFFSSNTRQSYKESYTTVGKTRVNVDIFYFLLDKNKDKERLQRNKY